MLCEKSCGACGSHKLKSIEQTKFSRGYERFKCEICGRNTAIPLTISTSVEIRDVD